MKALIASAGLLLLVAACATTTLETSWKDPSFSGPAFKKILVVGVSRSDTNRRVFEEGFASALVAQGAGAEASYKTLPESGTISNARITEAVSKTGSDAVLVTRLLRVDKNVSVSAPMYMGAGPYRGFYGAYGGAWMATPADVRTYDVLTIESTLWDMKADKTVWSGTTEVTEPKDIPKATAELAKVLIGKMKADGVI